MLATGGASPWTLEVQVQYGSLSLHSWHYKGSYIGQTSSSMIGSTKVY